MDWSGRWNDKADGMIGSKNGRVDGMAGWMQGLDWWNGQIGGMTDQTNRHDDRSGDAEETAGQTEAPGSWKSLVKITVGRLRGSEEWEEKGEHKNQTDGKSE